MPLIIGIDNEGNISICIDEVNTVYKDGKGQSELCMTIESGVIITTSKKLGLVMTSSKEGEVISNDKRLPKYV